MCRVPEELRRHSLIDGEGGEYSTNLDRNRYGGDNQYLATVIRYNLEFLDLCPCLVNVEIIQCKGDDGRTCVAADPQQCNCQHRQQVRSFMLSDINLRYGRSLELAMYPQHILQPAFESPFLS